MTFDEYSIAALRTATRAIGEEVSEREDLMIFALGLCGEAGEVADLIKKEMGHGHKRDTSKLVKELGDVLWYLTVISDRLSASLDCVAAQNIAKLKARYPGGFNHADSSRRADETKGEQ